MGNEYTFTIRDPATLDGVAFKVSYDAFVDDVQVRTAANHVELLFPSQSRVACPHRRIVDGVTGRLPHTRPTFMHSQGRIALNW